MHAVIKTCIGIHDIIYYMERKLKTKEGECIYAGNFLKEAAELTFHEKKQRFDELIAMNQRTHRSIVHAILGFAPGEKPDNEKMAAIAREYIQRIGFGEQPFLVYRHYDTARAHMHILTTKIRADGSRIPESFIGALKSQPARRAIEEMFGLVKNGQRQGNDLGENHDPTEKIIYGKFPTFQAMSDTLRFVLDAYRYRSLPELNAILRLYNLVALNGQPGSRLHEHRGLMYQVIDEEGRKKITPIKASDFEFNPGLRWLEGRFAATPPPDPVTIQHVRFVLDGAIHGKPADSEAFADILRRKQLAAVPFFDRYGGMRGLFFVDLSVRTSVTTGDLGNEYEAEAIRKRLGFDPFPAPVKGKKQGQLGRGLQNSQGQQQGQGNQQTQGVQNSQGVQQGQGNQQAQGMQQGQSVQKTQVPEGSELRRGRHR